MTDPLLDRVRFRLATRPEDVAPELVLDQGARDELARELGAELLGAGPLEPLLAEPGATDVLVNAADQVFLDRGAGLERMPVRFPSDEGVRRLAARLAAQVGRRLDDAQPFVDAVLPDGTRLHAILPPLVMHPTISLRILGRRRLSLPELVALGTMPAAVADVLLAVMRARLSVLISGGTGAGKTSLLAALLGQVPAEERILTIEDAPELAIEHPHVVSLLARGPNAESAGAIGLIELVRQALRMRADRLVVGEFRGGEIVELLAALNTGHAGGAATVHANSAQDVPSRLIALAALAGMTAETLLAQAASALDVLVQVRRRADGSRRVEQLALWPRGLTKAPQSVWTADAGRTEVAIELGRRLTSAGVDAPELLR